MRLEESGLRPQRPLDRRPLTHPFEMITDLRIIAKIEADPLDHAREEEKIGIGGGEVLPKDKRPGQESLVDDPEQLGTNPRRLLAHAVLRNGIIGPPLRMREMRN